MKLVFDCPKKWRAGFLVSIFNFQVYRKLTSVLNFIFSQAQR